MANDSALTFNSGTTIALGTMTSWGFTAIDSFTVEMWINSDSASAASTTGVYFLTFRTGGGYTVRLLTQSNTIKLEGKGYTGAPTNALVVQSNHYPGWTHIAFIYDNVAHNFQVAANGEILATTPMTLSSLEGEPHLGKGQALTWNNVPIPGASWTGVMSEVRVFRVVRSREEIRADMYRRLSGTEPNLLSYLPLTDFTTSQGVMTTPDLKPNSTPKTVTNQGTATSGFVPSRAATAESFALYAPNSSVVAAEFDGSTSGISVAHSSDLALTSRFTIEAWVRPQSLARTYDKYPVLSKRGGTTSAPTGWELRAGNSSVSFSMKLTALVETTASFTPGAAYWYHLAVVYNGTSVVIYVNGASVATTTTSGTFSDSGTELRIGRNAAGDTFCGHIASVRIWNSARTAAEIMANRFVLGSTTNLVARYVLDGDARERSKTTTPNPLDGAVTRVRWTRSNAPLQESTQERLELARASEPAALEARISALDTQRQTAEGQRDTAISERDTALAEKTAADLARGKALEGKAAAEAARNTALADKSAAEAARDVALADKAAADAARGKALADKSTAEAVRDAALADKSAAEGARDAALADKSAADAARGKALADKSTAEAVRDAALADKSAAEAARDVALADKAAADAARGKALEAKAAAEAARAEALLQKLTAEAIRDAALADKSAADAARGKALESKLAAEAARDAALADKSAAEAARDAALADKSAADAARGKALESKQAAEAARDAALADKSAAEAARNAALADKAAADLARGKALEAQAAADAARDAALADKRAAEVVCLEALEEMTAADLARGKALEAKAAAEAARDALLADKAAAEAVRDAALEDKIASDLARGKALEEKTAAEIELVRALADKANAEKARADIEEENGTLKTHIADLEKPSPPPRRSPLSDAASTSREVAASVPIGDFVRTVATAVADAQFKLDRSSIQVAEYMSGFYPLRSGATGEYIDDRGQPVNAPVMIDSRVQFGHRVEAGKRVPNLLSMMELGFVPNFYQFVDTVIEVRLALKVEKTSPMVDPTTGKPSGTSAKTSDVKLSTTPVDASYAGGYNYNLDMASVFKTKLVCVPPPAALEERMRDVLRQETLAASATVETPAEAPQT